eukprot:CAMPEP_0116844488 /NCGR_PEP_ID=MMETSP0418-20121206/12721_1 /TAXON_ID=1158023 /ORGANISM="Astrosyne radiata, Strain 13vi08-1A" /LENGTH=233 /DNA_ID=CAMNT_0004475457 /DNA_START=217 /DNA_END=918 /DNA_ORIENTATION=-
MTKHAVQPKTETPLFKAKKSGNIGDKDPKFSRDTTIADAMRFSNRSTPVPPSTKSSSRNLGALGRFLGGGGGNENQKASISKSTETSKSTPMLQRNKGQATETKRKSVAMKQGPPSLQQKAIRQTVSDQDAPPAKRKPIRQSVPTNTSSRRVVRQVVPTPTIRKDEEDEFDAFSSKRASKKHMTVADAMKQASSSLPERDMNARDRSKMWGIDMSRIEKSIKEEEKRKKQSDT